MPKRLQLHTYFDFNPPGSKRVIRTSNKSTWGNPFIVIEKGGKYTAEEAVSRYREYILQKIKEDPEKYNIEELRGKDLICTCKIGAPCHGDALLEIISCTPEGHSFTIEGVKIYTSDREAALRISKRALRSKREEGYSKDRGKKVFFKKLKEVQ